MMGKAGEHLRQQLLRALGVAGFGERPCGQKVIVDELRMVGMVLRETACQRQHQRVMLLPRGELCQRINEVGGQGRRVNAFKLRTDEVEARRVAVCGGRGVAL